MSHYFRMHGNGEIRVHQFRAGILACLVAAASSSAIGAGGAVRVRPPNEVEFSATVHASKFDRWIMPGYHAIVWKDGSAASHALLVADASDVEVLDALERLGAKPGDNLSMDAWKKRRDPKSAAPDTSVAGPAVEILLRLPGRAALVPLASVLEDPGGRGLAMRFGGNRANSREWMSGCIACLFSCPGSKVGNARYTLRDYVKDTTRFRVHEGVLPPDGTRIGVVLRLLPAGP